MVELGFVCAVGLNDGEVGQMVMIGNEWCGVWVHKDVGLYAQNLLVFRYKL